MLNFKLIRENPEFFKKNLSAKGFPPERIDALLELDRKRRETLQETEVFRAKRNVLNDEISRLKKQKKDVEPQILEGKSISQKIGEIDNIVGELDNKIEEILVNIPNIPDKDVPIGKDASANQIIREWGKKPSFSFKPKNHMVLAADLGWILFEEGAKVTGSAFPIYMGSGAKLERALINFMMDLHAKQHGYCEVWPPVLVNRKSMFGTGQLPKMKEDMYQLKDDDLFLTPTAEVPVTNIHRGEILDEQRLPVKYVAYSPCLRREAGSYGKETKGLSRVHQFDKVELVKIVKPETSSDELETLLRNAEKVLQLLEIPYRVVFLSTRDLSFSAAKCYDIEAWAPASGQWFEVSSCSLFFDFQARRMNIRYRPAAGGKTHFVHTLNGSGVALARTVLCLLENHQQKDGTVRFPKALEPYLT